MTEVLLKELTNSDIDWMLAIGSREEVAAGTVLIRQGQPVNALYVLLDGAMSVLIAQADQNPLGRAFSILEGGEMTGREITRLSSGEMLGEIPFLKSYLPSTTIKALKKSLVLSIPQQQLAQKLQQDVSFAAHLYRASAILLAKRVEQIFSQLGHSTVVLSQPQLREILFVFAELRDSDIDWLVAVGNVDRIAAGTVLIQGNRPIEALYIVLDGKVALRATDDDRSPLERAFSSLEGSDTPEREFARLSRGDIIGETPFVEAPPPSVTFKALEDSIVLSIPRSRLAAKLLNDVGFAARFYRVLAVLLADKQQAIVSRLGYGRVSYSKDQSLDENSQYGNELSSDFLAQVVLAGARFDWMLKRIRLH
ncbi:cyclic nucleotide-binding protein (plasmid) [Scytonema sp. HK-05]|uniref:cyclic nucleotide-binding domain-containing protein n=1 Tax=Scytonema sp. HK-05 TaxID=1137095 RepID=UPI0009360C8D|nr:cyclic nucleotide-binding domain-containing protein [Scytonema sp. HK-05]OKH57081.1 cyclic nucleotide-binding protein [Scytonema sp. HK-05]BAY50285.1 cyclic nucleotide-binding protein [Scytonema sp. HK-05]